MRSLAIFILVIISVLATMPAPQAQEQERPEGKTECASSPSLKQLEVELSRRNTLSLREANNPPTDAPYELPLTIHIVRRSDGTGGISLDDLSGVMQDLNRLWQPVGVQFFIFGNIDYINSDTSFNVPNVQASRDALRQINPVASTINVYFTNLATLCGQSTFTTDAIQGVLIDITCASVRSSAATANVSTFAHEIGHYFDLYHTHENWPNKMGVPTLVECPSGNNCSTTGDMICDTPADPSLQTSAGAYRVDANCTYDNSATTPSSCDSTAYNPPTRNLMSYSRPGCRTDFTAQQIQKVLRVLRDTNNRKNLIINGVRYVDPVASLSNADCSYNFPCPSVTKAIQVALNGDFIFIKPGFYQGQVGGKRVTLTKWMTGDGVVRITP